jgi:hypothetical protein
VDGPAAPGASSSDTLPVVAPICASGCDTSCSNFLSASFKNPPAILTLIRVFYMIYYKQLLFFNLIN